MWRATVVGVAILSVSAAYAHHNAYHSWLMSWIPQACCVTSEPEGCCWEISEREVDPLPGDQWRIRSTGQVIARTDFSPDGKFYRCACDYDGKKWHRHQGANTRCLFVPHQGS